MIYDLIQKQITFKRNNSKITMKYKKSIFKTVNLSCTDLLLT